MTGVELNTRAERDAAAEILAATEHLSPKARRRVLERARRKYTREHDALQAKVDGANTEMAALTAISDWMKDEEAWVLEQAESSRLARFQAQFRQGAVFGFNHESDDRAWLSGALEGVQVFVVQHDWAAAFRGAHNFDSGEIKFPADPAAFEFQISGRRFIMVVHDGEYMGLCECSQEGWVVTSRRPAMPEGVERSRELITQNVRAICILLDAQVADIEVIRASHRLNRAREKRGQLPLHDYHVVKLASRSRVTSLPNIARTDRQPPRLHFRRGHWRHFDNHKTWINWTLVGNPDLGFVDKEYRL